jgi:hypothetical protein
MTKIIAYYLPQFHEVDENNEWWGKGFTEWDNVKKSEPLFHRHCQPTLPLNEHYYNLLNKEVVEWQTNLSKDHNIFGFAYYHYWYNGRLILEKPAENLLKWKEINQNFCFMWANHNWTNSWKGKNDILIKQEYGTIDNWLNHFSYLSTFFKDSRYIKIDNKPVFMIYLPVDVPCLKDIKELWDEECKKIGFDGIYIINTIWEQPQLLNKEITENCDAITFKEFRFTQQFLKTSKHFQYSFFKWIYPIYLSLAYNGAEKFETYSYKQLCATSLKLMKKLTLKKTAFFNVFTGWDTTPRYGQNASIVIGSCPKIFGKHLKKIKNLSVQKGHEFIFIRAWNEWGQGMILEPTKKYDYQYLENICKVMEEVN